MRNITFVRDMIKYPEGKKIGYKVTRCTLFEDTEYPYVSFIGENVIAKIETDRFLSRANQYLLAKSFETEEYPAFMWL